MRFRGVVLLPALLVAGCGDSKPSPSTTAAATTATSSTAATSATIEALPGNDIQTLDFKTADGTVIDYVLLVPPGRAVGQPGRVLLTFPPGGQDIELTQSIVKDRWDDEAPRRSAASRTPATTSASLAASSTAAG